MKAGKIIMKNIKGSDGNACNRIKGARYFLKAFGRDRGEKSVLCFIIVLEIFFMMLGVRLLQIRLSRSRGE